MSAVVGSNEEDQIVKTKENKRPNQIFEFISRRVQNKHNEKHPSIPHSPNLDPLKASLSI